MISCALSLELFRVGDDLGVELFRALLRFEGRRGVSGLLPALFLNPLDLSGVVSQLSTIYPCSTGLVEVDTSSSDLPGSTELPA